MALHVGRAREGRVHPVVARDRLGGQPPTAECVLERAGHVPERRRAHPRPGHLRRRAMSTATLPTTPVTPVRQLALVAAATLAAATAVALPSAAPDLPSPGAVTSAPAP